MLAIPKRDGSDFNKFIVETPWQEWDRVFQLSFFITESILRMSEGGILPEIKDTGPKEDRLLRMKVFVTMIKEGFVQTMTEEEYNETMREAMLNIYGPSTLNVTVN